MKAYEYLLEKGINKVHQPYKRYNLTVQELVLFLEEYAQRERALMVTPSNWRIYTAVS